MQWLLQEWRYAVAFARVALCSGFCESGVMQWRLQEWLHALAFARVKHPYAVAFAMYVSGLCLP